MLEPGSIVILKKEAAEEIMRRWPVGHPFHELAKFLTEHPDARILIRNCRDTYCEISLTPETFLKYKEKPVVHHSNLCNWREHWFEMIDKLELPKPEYRIGEEVFLKDCGKYHRVTIKGIEAIWNFYPCTFKTWGYYIPGHSAHPYPENRLIPTFQHEKNKKNNEPEGLKVKESESEVTIYPPIILKPEDNFDEVFDRLIREGWMVNSALYMQADTLEEAVKLQAKSFPSREFQPVLLPNPTIRHPFLRQGKWVAFHRKPESKPLGEQIEPDGLVDEKDTLAKTETLLLTNKKQKYSIHIKHPAWEGFKYSLYYAKNYGDYSGGITEFKTKEELIKFVRQQFRDWEKFDSIIGRHGDKVTPSNLDFQSFTSEITKMELFGVQRLDVFLEMKNSKWKQNRAHHNGK